MSQVQLSFFFSGGVGSSPPLFLFPLRLRWQEKPLPRTNPTDGEPRARPPTRAPSLHVIGHLHLCTVTGSIADLWRKEAEASRPSQGCFVRGFLAVPWPPPSRLRWPSPSLLGSLRRSLVGRQLPRARARVRASRQAARARARGGEAMPPGYPACACWSAGAQLRTPRSCIRRL